MSTAENIQEENLTLSDFVPLAEFVEANPHVWRTMQAARWAINNADRNGLNEYGVLVKRGSRIQIVVPRLVKWLAAGIRGQ